ncbi:MULTISPECIES: hypothetical protein [unclassified Sporosarcina]|nr:MULTISPECIES: hypothetical protein [unclassified Sporosarcina]QTD43202.1 hypothetical protein J3U78_10880 [Sporosarcina sp. Te-1]GKV56513.1 hypothetical protein NCCP2222_24600 [Sporosarcina sp. NCCP-2222]
MKKEKGVFALASIFLSAGLLVGCNGVDENEPDPTEEPSEQRQDENNNQ